MSAQVRTIVARTWIEHIGVDPSWTHAQTQTFFDRETARMDARIVVLAAEAGQLAVAEWTRTHRRDPDHQTQVSLLVQAHDQAQELVLTQELYELIPAEDDREVPSSTPASEQRWTGPQRWRGTQRSEPSEETEAMVEALWPARSMLFQVSAALLWQARLEDGLVLPQAPDQVRWRDRRTNAALLAELTGMVETDLRESQLPPG